MNLFFKAFAAAAVVSMLTASVSCGQVDETAIEDSSAVISENASEKTTKDASKKSEKTTSATSVSSNSSSKTTSSKTSTEKTTTTNKSSGGSSGSGSRTNSNSYGGNHSGGNSYGYDEDDDDSVSDNDSGNSSNNNSNNNNNNSAGGSNNSGSNSNTNSGGNNSSHSGNNNNNNNSSGGNSSVKPTSSSQNKPNNNSGNNNNNQNQQNNNNNSGNSGNSTPESPAQPEPTEAPTESEETYTAEITLGGSPAISGENAYADGSRVVINGGGDFVLRGSIDGGQVEVKTTEKVKLRLEGVYIRSNSGPALLVSDAKRLTIVLAEGTESTLSDTAKDKINDGVICSNDTVEIRGKGSLNIVAGNAHGITSDDDVVIENGNINITSVKSGIIANDDITINGGSLRINGGTNGIKSKGTVTINGGYSVICGGTKEEKSSVYAAAGLSYTGGYVFAAGNTVTPPSYSANPYVVAGFNEAQPAGSTVSMVIDGTQLITMYPQNNFRCLMMLAPEIYTGCTFGTEVNGVYHADYPVENLQNIFTIE